MEIQITSTENITLMDAVPVRVWNGVTAEGVACLVFVHRIAVARTEDATAFDRELQEQLPPGRSVPLSAIL